MDNVNVNKIYGHLWFTNYQLIWFMNKKIVFKIGSDSLKMKENFQNLWKASQLIKKLKFRPRQVYPICGGRDIATTKKNRENERKLWTKLSNERSRGRAHGLSIRMCKKKEGNAIKWMSFSDRIIQLAILRPADA